MHTDTGGTILFVRFQGPTTGARPIYEGRMNLERVRLIEEEELEH